MGKSTKVGEAEAETAAEGRNEPGFGNARVVTADEYFQRVRHHNVRPAKWSAEDMMETLEELGKDPLATPSGASFRWSTKITASSPAASPGIFIGIQLIHPGELVPNHRHNSVAIYHYLQGTGFTTVEGTRFAFKKGDTIVCPAWAYHEHEATGDEDTIMYVTQDMTEMAAKRTLFFEEPQGLENVRHMVQGTSKSWSATRDPDKE